LIESVLDEVYLDENELGAILIEYEKLLLRHPEY
jgi:hypothetical protein